MTVRSEPTIDLSGIPAPDLRNRIDERARRMPVDPGDPPPFPPAPRRAATALAVAGALVVLGVAGFLLWSSVGQHPTVSISPSPHATTGPTPSSPVVSGAPVTQCSEVVPGCTATRLPDLVLHGSEQLGVLGPIDGISFDSATISSDQALAAGAHEGVVLGGRNSTVRVVLGSADRDALQAGSGTGFYYALQWTNVCAPLYSVGTDRPCRFHEWTTVVDALRGREVTSGPDAIGVGSSPEPQPLVPGPLAGDGHTPAASLTMLAAPLDIGGVSPTGEPLVVEPATPTDAVMPPLAAVDEAWGGGRSNGFEPDSVTIEFGLLEGHPEWLVVFDGLCLPGTGPSQLPGSSPRPVPSCITTSTAVIDAVSGKELETLG
jgi:hypothetical protein